MCAEERSFLAVDIGASSGRHILGRISGGRMSLKEIYRFENGFTRQDGSLVWDIDSLEKHVTEGIIRCGQAGFCPESIAVDTWGVDYVLLDGSGGVIGPVYCYRDGRTEAAAWETEKIIPFEELYGRTGIQKQSFNTVYQLWCDKKSGRLDAAARLLMIPDYLAWRLTGVMKSEYTNATTTGLVSAGKTGWDREITEALGYPEHIFLPLSMPGSEAGPLRKDIAERAGFDARVVLCASHDTASAVAACPLKEDFAYISSGTWSLIGMELSSPVINEGARRANFTNEGGVGMRVRFLKNYMGMWLLQGIRKDLGKRYTYDEMMEMAEESGEPAAWIDVNSPELTVPESMISAVRGLMGDKNAELPRVINCVYHSLARSYRSAVEEIEKLTGRRCRGINIVGGGCSDVYLNRLTAGYTGLPVCAGPKEATAAGNIIVQLMAADKTVTIEKARELVGASLGAETIYPEGKPGERTEESV